MGNFTLPHFAILKGELMRTLNLFLGFAFVIFGYSALMMIPEFKNYLGQETVAWFIFYALSFCLSFIAWALSYAYIKEEQNPLNNIGDRLKQVEAYDRLSKAKRECNTNQMELKL
jgi:membrane protein implicated in regulation of membrane protease activity